MNYTKTTWENDITPVSAENMNKIENQLKALTDAVYPVGSIYISVKSTNPSSFFGGTWVAFGTGRTLVGINTSDTNFDTIEKTGGAATHTLTTTEMPSHTHTIGSSGAHNHASQGRMEGSGTGANIFESYNGASKTRSVNVPRTGTNGNHTHSPGSSGSEGNKLAVDKANMPPYAVVKYIICAF